MTRKEVIQILTFLSQTYESFEKRMNTKEKVDNMIYLWESCLGDLDYNMTLKAVKRAIIENPYPPTIHDIRKNVVMLNGANNTSNALKDWEECYKMMCNGNYMTREEFESHSEICKLFLGSLEQLRSYSMNSDINLDVVRSNFLKQHDIYTKRLYQQSLIPEDIRDTINTIAEKVDVKQIEN